LRIASATVRFQETAANRGLGDARIEIESNIVERASRPIALN
jgi:hypothetical protein